MNLEDKAREYAEGKSSASVFRDAHIRDFKAGYREGLKDSKAPKMLEMLKYIVEEADRGQYLDNEDIFDIKHLIKEATEL